MLLKHIFCLYIRPHVPKLKNKNATHASRLYLHILPSKRLYIYGRGRLPDTLRYADWPRGPCRHRSHCRSARHTRRSQGDNANTPFALCLRRTSRDSLARTGPRGGSDTPHILHREPLSARNSLPQFSEMILSNIKPRRGEKSLWKPE